MDHLINQSMFIFKIMRFCVNSVGARFHSLLRSHVFIREQISLHSSIAAFSGVGKRVLAKALVMGPVHTKTQRVPQILKWQKSRHI